VDGQVAVPCEKRRREILESDARTTRHDDHIGVGMQRVQDGIVFVRHQTRKLDETSVTSDEGGEHRPVRVDDLIAARLRTTWQQFVAGDHQPDAWSGQHAYFSHAHGTEYSQILRAQDASSLE
jgi:hypothetical protein